MKYSKDDIIKALECCSPIGSESCDGCPLREECEDSPLASVMAERALELIKDLVEENKRLREIPEQLYKEMSDRISEERKIERKLTLRRVHANLLRYTENVGECSIDNPPAETYLVVREENIDQVINEMLEECRDKKGA